MKGLVVAIPRNYENIALKNLEILRKVFKVKLPIEVWEVGKEISSEIRELLKKLGGIVFKNVEDYSSVPNKWKGWQIKAFAAQYCHFDEFILFDADVFFYQNPVLLFSSEGYKKTGTFFFRDLNTWKFHDLVDGSNENFTSLSYFTKRKEWIRSLCPIRSGFFPKEWNYIYDDILPGKPVDEAYMEAGVVAFDKNRHADSLSVVFQLNENYEETYKRVHGDKETWWLACCMVGKEFHMNEQLPSTCSWIPYRIRRFFPQNIFKLTHYYGRRKFFRQK